MRWLIVLCVLCVPVMAYAGLPDAEVDRIADAIYRVEGGAKTMYPYGIKSVKCSGEQECRQVCENTIRNNYVRWIKSGQHQDYIEFLADRYCPYSVDPVGNVNWKKNIRSILND